MSCVGAECTYCLCPHGDNVDRYIRASCLISQDSSQSERGIMLQRRVKQRKEEAEENRREDELCWDFT